MIEQKLLNRVQPKKGEAFQGYVERLAIRNHVKPNDLLLFARVRVKYPANSIEQKDSLLSLLIGLTGFESIEALFDARIIPREYKPLFDLNLLKVCFNCLDECAIFQDVWSFKHYVVCIDHGTSLITHCPKCGAKITFQSVFQIKCSECQCDLKTSGNLKIFHEPISEYIFQVFDRSEDSLVKIAKKVQQLQPYLRLVNKGRFDNIKSLRKGDLLSLAKLQAMGAELMEDSDKSVETLTNYLASKVNTLEWSKSLHSFREVTTKPQEYEFANVMKRTIVEGAEDIGGGAISFELLAKIWSLDVGKLTEAIKISVPDQALIKIGRHKIKCSDFTKYQERIFAAYSELLASN